MKHGNFMQDMQIQIWDDLGFSVYAMPHVAVKRGMENGVELTLSGYLGSVTTRKGSDQV